MKTLFLLLLSSIVNFSLVFSQTIDSTFHAPLPIRPAIIQCIKHLQDGKLLVGGDINFYQNKKVNPIIRLNADGTIDETFKFSKNGSLMVINIEFQSTGDLIVLATGYESTINMYTGAYFLYRVTPDGTVKNEYSSLVNVNSIAIQNDDKILICGGLNANGYLKRFNSDLTPDQTFNSNVSFNGQVTDIVANNNKLYASGLFSSVNDTLINNIVKLNLNGTIDVSFNPGAGTDQMVGSLTLQPDGKIILGKSSINSFNGTPCHGTVRLNPDGSVDTGFSLSSIMYPASEIFIQNNEIFVAGYYINNPNQYLIKLNLDGSLDETFNPIPIKSNYFGLSCLIFTEDGLIINNTNGNKYGLSKYNGLGNFVNTFTPEVSRYGTIKTGDFYNNKLVIAGDFIKINETETFGLARINLDGSIDETFVLDQNYGYITQIKVLNKDSLLVATEKAFFNLDSKGVTHPYFDFKPFKDLYYVDKFRMLGDGKIIAGTCNNVYRLNANGSEDFSFNIGTGVYNVCSTYDFDIQDDKVIFGSMFTKFNGVDVNSMVRLNSNGSVDHTFDIGLGPNDGICGIKVLDSKEILVAGFFNAFNGIQIPNHLVKLSKDGTLDLSFNENQKKSSFAYGFSNQSRVEQLDSLIFIKSTNSIVVLDVKGNIYNNFNIPFTINGINDIITVQDTSQIGSSKNSNSATTTDPTMFVMGTIKKTSTSDPSFVEKLLNIRPITNNNNTSIDSNYKLSKDFQFEIYPNPVEETLKIHSKKQSEKFRITIYNIAGNKVFESQFINITDDSIIDVNVQNLVSGFYLIKLSSNSETLFSQKFVKK